ncbi:MAG: AarF/UbiB family protein, partial [Oceanococcus sp.]
PFFVKMAQVAAANADVLPEEIAKELAVFHEDVPPMSPDEVLAAFDECYGTGPENLYMDFDPAKPMKSGSIGSVYLAKKPFNIDGKDVLVPVVVKVGRHNIDREFVIGKMVIGLAIMSSQYWAPHSKLTPFLRALSEQVEEFVEGFQQELDFYEEARNQMRFYERSAKSRRWQVPAIYGATRRILEMEYLQDTTSLVHALENHPPKVARRLQKRLAQNLLYSVLHHIFLYQEVHGDLHPGNVLVNSEGELYLIDWGNCVTMDGKWGAVWDYLVGAVLADLEILTDALIAISTSPSTNLARREEIRDALEETLKKKGVVPLTRKNFIRELGQGGLAGLHKRGQTILHLASNTQQLGLVVRSDYLHLSRSLFAAVGSFAGLYADASRTTVILDMLGGVTGFPWRLAKDKLDVEVDRVRGRLPLLQNRRLERRERLRALSVDMP